MTAMTDLSPAAMEQAWDAYNFEEASNGFTDDRAALEAAILAYLAALPVQEVMEGEITDTVVHATCNSGSIDGRLAERCLRCPRIETHPHYGPGKRMCFSMAETAARAVLIAARGVK